jgi:hypothetical protein
MGLFFPVALLWIKRVGDLPWRNWVVRNVLVHKRPVLLMTTAWLALGQGNNEAATGPEFTTDGRPIKRPHSSELPQRLEGRSEVEQMDGFRDAALTFIRTQPARAAELYVRKLAFFWWRSPHTGVSYSRRWTVISQAWYLVFIGCAIVGFMVLARAGPERWAIARLILWLAVCFSAGQGVFYIGGRHRWTIEPVLGLLSAAGSWWSSQRIMRPGVHDLLRAAGQDSIRWPALSGLRLPRAAALAALRPRAGPATAVQDRSEQLTRAPRPKR